MRTHTIHTWHLVILYLICCLLVASSCSGGGGDNRVNANVLLYWPGSEDDPVYVKWTEMARKELRRQGIKGDVHVRSTDITERDDASERKAFNEYIFSLRASGSMPDLILSYGDENKWLMTTNFHPGIISVPTVCYGLHITEYPAPMTRELAGLPNAGRKNMVSITDRYRLEENLILADSIITHMLDKIRKPDYYLLTDDRLVTLLDVEDFWADRIRYDDLYTQMELMDTAHFYNNLHSEFTEGRLRRMAIQEDKMIFSCRSILAPSWNVNQKANPLSTAWAFYPQKSPNFYIQSKYDSVSRELVESSCFMPYFTMVAEDFLHNEKCIGGCFTPFETQIREAVAAGKRLLRGEDASEIGTLEHSASLNLNWDVLRPMGFDYSRIPDFINISNAGLKDSNPKLHRRLVLFLWIFIAFILVWTLVVVAILARKARNNALKMQKYADEVLLHHSILDQVMNIIDFKTWEDNTSGAEGLSRISASDFFMGKLKEFTSINEEGKHSMEVYCSIDGKPSHWYEIRMTVTPVPGSTPSRRGMVLNIDEEKELEAKAAQVNRIVNTLKAREGFIASMDHELRTPLNLITGYTQLLSMPGMEISDEDFAEYANAIEVNVSTLRHTITNIMTANRIRMMNITPRIEPVTMESLLAIHRSRTNLGVSSKVMNRIVMERETKDMTVKADAMLLAEVLRNLLVNAAKYSDESSKITIGWKTLSEDGFSGEICISDEGIGIAPEYQELIFDGFFKVDSFAPGCGLGLYICKTFVELMGGQISVESKVGEGSVFKIKLP
ncbi:MAG: sensor histidine kinase [Candidatus Cryptobacteroides sp.]